MSLIGAIHEALEAINCQFVGMPLVVYILQEAWQIYVQMLFKLNKLNDLYRRGVTAKAFQTLPDLPPCK